MRVPDTLGCEFQTGWVRIPGTCTPFAISISSCLFLTSYLTEGAPMGRKERRQLARRKSPDQSSSTRVLAGVPAIAMSRTSPDIGRRPRVRSAGRRSMPSASSICSTSFPTSARDETSCLFAGSPEVRGRRDRSKRSAWIDAMSFCWRRALYAATAVLADTSCQCRSTASQVRYLLGYRRAKAQMRREHDMAARWDDEIAELTDMLRNTCSSIG